MSKLILIRGPSGSGKSTVASELLKVVIGRTLLVSEDRIRKMFSDHHQPRHRTSKIVATQAVTTGLESGYDVIYEGILDMRIQGKNLKRIINANKDESYLFYLEVSFEETLKRHETRPQSSEFAHEAMKEWWDYASPTSLSNEFIIPETSSLRETIETIGHVTKLELDT